MSASIVDKVVCRAPANDPEAPQDDAPQAGNRAGTAVAVIGSGASLPEAAEKAARAQTKVADTSNRAREDHKEKEKPR